MSERHELFEILDAAAPQWQTEFNSLYLAAARLGAVDEYNAYMLTDQGKAYLRNVLSAWDHIGDNAKRRAEIQAHMAMASRAGFTFGTPA
jgi:hypothetical protein